MNLLEAQERYAAALADVAARHGLVLKEPAPQVYLDEYGESAVYFALTYWVDMSPSNDSRRVRSDLLHMIDRAFADPSIRAVLANTLAGPNPSTRVLEKAGFVHAGEVIPVDGIVLSSGAMIEYRAFRNGDPPGLVE